MRAGGVTVMRTMASHVRIPVVGMVTTHHAVVAACLLLAFATAPPVTAAQDAAYLAVIETYASGNVLSAVSALAAWSEARVRSSPRLLRSESHAYLTKAAVMLHTEVAFEKGADSLASTHLDVARSHLTALRDASSTDAFVARWHGLAAIYHAMQHRYDAATTELNRGRARGPALADLELLSAVLREVSIQFGEPNLRGAWSTFNTAVLQNDLKAIVSAYQRVVGRFPDSLEARLRLGWALHLARSPSTRARQELEHVARHAARADLRYLSHLFLAAVAERDRRLDDAWREYEAAHEAEPHQSSLVALIGLASARGLTDRVAQLAAEMARMSADRSDDPWLYYNSGFTGGGLLDLLRADARVP